ncbi:MAG TPA: GDSL-type esterase/lipase family protein [Pirellulales bacterium]
MKFSKYLVLLVLAISSPARAAVLNGAGIGVYGDSMSMQYSFWLPLAPQFNYNVFYNGTQYNWVDLLSQNGYNFGPSASYMNEQLKTYDVAISGEKSSDLPSQVDVLQPDITAGNVNLVVLMMGANDFDGAEYSTIYSAASKHSYNPLNDAGVQAFMSSIMSYFTSTVDATLAENPATQMILSTIPDVGVTPEFMANYPKAAQRAAVTAVTQAVNQEILALAKQHHFPVIDMFAMANRSLTPLTVGGVKLIESGGTSGKDEYLSDGFHPGTVVQGLMANGMLMAANLAYHDPVTYLSDQYILGKAGVSHNNTTSFFDVSPYVIVPEPSSATLAALGVIASLWIGRRSARRA